MALSQYLVGFAVVAAAAGLVVHPASAQTTERVSIDSLEAQANNISWGSSISADGRFVAFQSYATNLVAGDTNGVPDIFVRDRQTGETERVSVASLGAQANNQSVEHSISADGRFVAFRSLANNLVAGDTNANWDVFVRDRQTGETERVSVDSQEVQGNFGSAQPSISADGRFVAFWSGPLVADDTNGVEDVFVRDRQTGETERVSLNIHDAQGTLGSNEPSISADGRFVAFKSSAANLVYSDTNRRDDVFVRDRQTGETERVSVDSLEAQLNGTSSGPSISADGRFVVFLFLDSNNGSRDIFVRDRQTGETELVDVNSQEVPANLDSGGSSISADGRFVAFSSYATNLVTGDTNSVDDAFVRDRQTGETVRVSIDSLGAQANSASGGSSISADGRFVAFTSYASNLVAGDTNDTWDVFVRGDILTTIALSASPSMGGTTAGSGDYLAGTSRTVTAAANAGYRFVNWTEGGVEKATTASYTFNLTADRTLVAHFVPGHTIAVSASPVAGGTVTGSGGFDPGSVRTVTATPAGGYRFVNWTEGSAQVSTTASYTFTLNANRTLVANFALILHTVAVSASPAAGGTVTGAGTFPYGSSRTVAATPAAGYRFVKWTEGSTQVSTTANYTFVLTANRTLAANFARVFTISVSASPSDRGTVAGGGTFDPGTSRTVVATAKPGYEFARWTQNGALASNLPSYTFTVTANRALVAHFRLARRQNDLLVDLGTGGLWRYLNNATWQRLHTSSPVAIAAGDLDGSGIDEAIGSFGSGLYARFNNSANWAQLDANVAARLAVGDFEGTGRDDLVADRGAAGIFVLRNNTLPWIRLHPATAQGLVIGDLDGDGRDELLGDFSSGLWAIYNGGTAWTKLDTISPLLVATGDLDGNRKDEVIVGRGAGGIWVRYNNAGAFVRIHTVNSEGLATGDIDGDGKQDLLVDFGATGLYVRLNNTTWTKLHASNPVGILAADLDRNGKAEVIADFGATGLFARYNNAGAFVRKTNATSEAIAAGGFD
jgi:hypothetical protein